MATVEWRLVRRSVVAMSVVLFACSPEQITMPTSPRDKPSLNIVTGGGDGQIGVVGSLLPKPLVVQVTNVSGSSPNGQTLNFVVTSGGGSVFAPTVTTGKPSSGPGANLQGIGQDTWTLGPTAGQQTVEARLVDPTTGNTMTQAVFHATATAGPAKLMKAAAGDQQGALVGTAVKIPPAVLVTDAFANPIPNVSVTFAVKSGGGTITGAAATTVANGIATVGSWTLGTAAGADTLTATSSGLTGSPVMFAATATKGVAARITAPTLEFSAHVGTAVAPSPTVSVLDVNGNGVPNVAVTFTVTSGGGALDGVGTLATLTDATGSAKVNWTVGPAAGSNTLQATAEGLQGSPIRFGAITFACDCWSTKASMLTARRNIGIGAINGLVYTAGGFNSGYFATLEAYDPTINQWTTKASMPSAYAFPGSGVINGLLYLAGGFGPSGLVNTTQAYDPATDQWTPKAPIPTPRIEQANAVLTGLLYAIGGDNTGNGTPVATVEAYDPVLDQWITKKSMPTARFLAGAGVINGRLFVVGGLQPGQPVLSTVEVYDPSTDTWATAAPMPTPRYGVAVSVVNGLLYAIGGLNPNNLGTVEVYDPATDSWTTRAQTPMPTPRGVAASAVVNGVIYAVGGEDQTGVTVFGTNEAYQP